MTLQPVAPPHPLTVAEYLAIGEIEPGYSELVEGRLVMCASPVFDHQDFLFELHSQVRSQLPPGLVAAQDLDLDLQLVPADGPGTVRRPDLVVATREAQLRLRREGGVLRASEVVLVVEVVSPSSVRTDHVVKRGEYADAGIPHYWIVDLDDPVSLIACHLAGDFGYRDGGAVTGLFSPTAPFAVEIDLDPPAPTGP
ncbi:Uma2 family endonuclease [Pseudonocardia sp.]|uniref:Uma2 family endonuclease n=1 Tax=Pseudonocardia sp. TaxID=60912 RepID=UPI00263701E0|nr:Uma2 family endonuclease [Pseudonocardia sp.]